MSVVESTLHFRYLITVLNFEQSQRNWLTAGACGASNLMFVAPHKGSTSVSVLKYLLPPLLRIVANNVNSFFARITVTSSKFGFAAAKN